MFVRGRIIFVLYDPNDDARRQLPHHAQGFAVGEWQLLEQAEQEQ